MRAVLLVLAIVLVSFLAVTAHARATLDVALPLDRAFSGALRFVRVDRGCKVTDKDEQAAYVVFECSEGDGSPKTKRGNVELFSSDGKNVRIQVTLPDDPKYTELRFVELLERKLKEEYGSIKAPPRAPPPSKPPVDGGTP